MAEECNVDDILCQMGVLQNLRGLQTGMSNEAFLKEFPELQGLDGKLTAKIEATTLAVSEAIAKCGKPAPEEAEVTSAETVRALTEGVNEAAGKGILGVPEGE
ncbi:hypothetical protein LCGC14_1645180 [marine sediment metagenome]|uniref:Uncharacterized protein n=1 Tax=marine sediment metagenome TaxID=412755 RepID=A0A0F9HYF6_9ZZZZ